MDNLSPHKHEPTLRWIAQTGAAIRFLPDYSPDLNPIEKMGGKVKQFLRSAEARTEAELQQAIAAALAGVTAQNTINWFALCGYSIHLIRSKSFAPQEWRTVGKKVFQTRLSEAGERLGKRHGLVSR